MLRAVESKSQCVYSVTVSVWLRRVVYSLTMIHLVARGWGFFVIGFLVVFVLGTNIVVDAVLGPDTFESWAVWPALAVIAAGILTLITGRRLNHGPVPIFPRPAGTVFAPRLPFLFAPHSFLFIPMEAWGVLEIAVAAYVIVLTSLGL
jgi:hypothetical protein